MPQNIWSELAQYDADIAEDDHFAFVEDGKIRYALLVEAESRTIVPCEITTKGTLHELEELEELEENIHGMKILYDNKNRVIGPEEMTYPRWHEWKLRSREGETSTAKIKIRHIYRALLGKEYTRPNCEEAWEKRGVQPPDKGWPHIWNQFRGLLGTPRDYKTRFKFLHRGLFTAHRESMIAAVKGVHISNLCILCGRHQGTHRHVIECQKFEELLSVAQNFADMLGEDLSMSLEDRIYGLRNNGEDLPKGLRFFYAILIKHMWMAYTTQLKEGVEFDTRKVWTGILSRLKIVLHGFEVETKLKIEQMHRQFDSFNDFSEEQKEEIIEEEISRRNKKVDPLGIFDKEKDAGTSSYAFLYSFKWKDAHKLSDPDLNNSEG